MKITTDMYFAAVLMAYGANLVRVDKRDKKRQVFSFDGRISAIYVLDNEVCTRVVSPSFDDIENYWTAKKLLLPSSYPNAVKDMKSVIHTKSYVS